MTQNKIDETVSTVLCEVVVKFQKLSTKRIGFFLLRNIKESHLIATVNLRVKSDEGETLYG